MVVHTAAIDAVADGHAAFAPAADAHALPGPARGSIAVPLLRWARIAAIVGVGVAISATARTPGSPLDTVVVCALWIAAADVVANRRLLRMALGWRTALLVGALLALSLLLVVGVLTPWLDVAPTKVVLLGSTGLLFSVIQEVAAARRTPPSRVLIVGTRLESYELVRRIEEAPKGRFELVGRLQWHAGSLDDAPVALTRIIRERRPDVVVIEDGPAREAVVTHLLDVLPSSVRVSGIHDFYEHAFGCVPVASLGPVWFMSVFHLYQRPYSQATKRALDLTVAFCALVFAWPLFLAAALATRLSSPGPILFRQIRMGERGRPFRMLKFRTMIEGAEANGEARWAVENDPRVTRVGAVLRRTRIDELPQLWNVIRGEMSIVGPRPERPEFARLLQTNVPFWRQRHLVKPGITGWAQLQRGYTASMDETAEKLSYDLYYLRHRSLLLDCAIMVKTLETVVAGRGAR